MKCPTSNVGRNSLRAKESNNSLPLGQRSQNQHGAGAIELLVFLFVSILVVVAGVAWWNSLTSRANNQGELENIASLMTSVRSLKTASGYGPTGGNLVPVLTNGGGIPETMQLSGTSVFNVWGGAVTVASTGTGYTLTYAGVPAAACIFLAAKAPNSGGLSSLKINGGQALVGEVSAVNASAGCTTDSNTLAWSSR